MATGGRKKTRSTKRGWWWEEFTEHPGYKSSEPAAMVQQKAKVICTGQLEHYVAAEQARDEREVQFGSQDHVRDEHAIKGAGKLELYHLFVSDTCYCSMGYWAARSATDLARQPSENTSDTYTGL